MAARELAVKVLQRIFYQGGYANLSLDQGLKNSALNERDRGLVTELVNGTVRMKEHLDWVLNIFLTRSRNKLNSRVYVILLVSIYQLLFLERVPAYAVINEAVDMARKHGQGAANLVNGLLRNLERNRDRVEFPDADKDPVKYLQVFYSHPEWMVVRWLNRYGFEKTRDLLAFNNLAPPLTARVNSLKIGFAELLDVLREEGVEVQPGRIKNTSIILEKLPMPLYRLNSYRQGYFYIQGEATMLIPLMLDPEPGSLVYDCCAGVGGKSVHLAELMGNRGRIVALELHQHKLDLMKINCNRLGVTIVEGRQGDLFGQLPRMPASDSALLDAPCTGLGVLRSRPDIRWRRKEPDIAGMAEIQGKMLETLAPRVRPGGHILYSTCTIEPEENEQVIEGFLSRHSGYDVEALPGYSGEISTGPGMTFFPPQHGLDGMYMCLLRRR